MRSTRPAHAYPGAPTAAQRRHRYGGLGLVVAAIFLLTGSVATVGPGVATGQASVADRRCSALAPPPTDCARSWGMTLSVSNSTLPAAVAAYEQAGDRRLDIVHTYHRWYDDFPTASEQLLANSGHLLLFNWEPTDARGRPMSWAAIAAGARDAQIDALAQRLRSLPPVAISFSHEPELNFGAHGRASDFVAAFRHVHDRVAADGLTNVSWVWDVMGLSDPVWLARYPSLWPGDRYVDWIAWDPYNWAACRDQPWRSFLQVVAPFYGWLMGSGHGNKPFLLAEYGSIERPGDPLAKADWLSQIPAALAELPNLRGLVYFDVGAPPANCDWPVGTSAVAQRAFLALASTQPFRASAPSDSTIRLPAP